jgi:S1-C subfamily serine protease
LLAALLGAGVGTGATFMALDRDPVSAPAGRVVVQASGGTLESVAAVAKAVLPSIVRIDVGSRLGEGTGSGVIYREDGYIITNNHVVDGANDITVTLSTGKELPARVVGTAAPQVDIAVLKVDQGGLPVATLGDTHELEVGDLAVALGSPFGLQSTVTAGVVSALHRNITFGRDTRFSDAIQTDAPINPGNSGGALANGDGEVVGINTAILSEAGGSVGVGFAIPIEIAKRVADQIITTGRAQLPFIGISGQNLPDDRGALIQEVVSGGPAQRAGLRAGDIIVELDGQAIRSMDELISTLIQKEVGQTVRITYERDGNRRTAEVRLAARPEGS